MGQAKAENTTVEGPSFLCRSDLKGIGRMQRQREEELNSTRWQSQLKLFTGPEQYCNLNHRWDILRYLDMTHLPPAPVGRTRFRQGENPWTLVWISDQDSEHWVITRWILWFIEDTKIVGVINQLITGNCRFWAPTISYLRLSVSRAMCMYVQYIYILYIYCIYIYINIYIHIHTHTYIYIYMYVRVCVTQG